MSDYLPSFIVEPVLRQARRLSERIIGDDAPPTHHPPLPQPASDELVTNSRFVLPSVPTVDLQRFYPSRFWTQTPATFPAEEGRGIFAADVIAGTDVAGRRSGAGDEDESEHVQETTLMSIARNVQLWAAQINSLDVFPSPPLESVVVADPMDSVIPRDQPVAHDDEESLAEFPPLDVSSNTRPLSTDRPRSTPARHDSERSLNPAHELSYRSRYIEDNANGRSQSDPAVASDAAVAQNNAIVGQGFGQNDYNRRRDGSGALPEDDGMGPLRQRIHAIWAGPGSAQDKSRLVHILMSEKYRQGASTSNRVMTPTSPSTRAKSPSTISIVSQEVMFNLSPSDLEPTYEPFDPDAMHDDTEASGPELGCRHYKRNVKMQCVACEKWYTCRLCHDEVEDHVLPRRDTRYMLCMICKTPQSASGRCKACGTQSACYYCDICKLWNNDAAKSVYHCEDCGICRLGEGLGKDFFHCKTCGACMSIQAERTHRCIEKSTKCDCPICGEYMFTSNRPVAFMRCGHSIHEQCFAEWCNTSYKCPICSKSIANMESQFRRLDRHIESQPMPEEYRDNRAYVFCNDCNSRSVTRYHWLGLKCTVCDSYNTAQLELLGAESPAIQEQAERAQEMGVGEASITASQSHTPTEELTSPANGALRMTPMHPATDRAPTPAGRPSEVVEARSPVTGAVQVPQRRDSPFHVLPHSPSRNVRGASPVVGSYFGTGQAAAAPPAPNRRGSYFSVFSSGSNPPNDAGSSTGNATSQDQHRPPRSSFQYLQYQLGAAADRPGCTTNNSEVPARTNGAQLAPSPRRPHTDTSLPVPIPDPVSVHATTAVAGHEDEDEDLDFWGGQSPRSHAAEYVDRPTATEEAIEDDSSSSSEDEDRDHERMDDEEDEDEDMMDLMGHR